MKNFPIKIKMVLTASTLVMILLMAGCDQVPEAQQQSQQDSGIERNDPSSYQTEERSNITAQDKENLSQGNMFNIARDIAKLQIETDDYVTLLKQSQNNLEQAIQDKNTQQLQNTTGNMVQELHALHDALLAMQLKSQEVDQIRQNLLAANQQLLSTPLLNGQIDISKIDFNKIEKQLNIIQLDIVKLATLVLNTQDNTENSAA